MQIAAICADTGWTYQEYLSQPEWFIKILEDKYEIDAENSRKQTKK
jgi:hypothetical protein